MRAIFTWLSGLVRRRYGRMLPAVLGVSLTIALLSILGIFINASAATMTQRALGDVPIDWQIQLVGGATVDSVEQQLNQTVTVRAVDPVEARNDAALILRALDLSELADKLPEEISGGQAQRAAVARSLITQPELILADEPTGQLDHHTAKHLLSLLLRRIKGTDTALVIATHDPFVASRMETQWTMDHGVLR